MADPPRSSGQAKPLLNLPEPSRNQTLVNVVGFLVYRNGTKEIKICGIVKEELSTFRILTHE